MRFRYRQSNVRRLLPAFDCCRARGNQIVVYSSDNEQSSAVVVSWEDPPNTWLTAAKNAFVGWALNFRVRVLLKNAVKQCEDCKRGYLVYTERDWNQGCCHGNNIAGAILFLLWCTVAKFEDHCSNISLDILNSVFYRFSGTIYDVITFLICIIQKREYL